MVQHISERSTEESDRSSIQPLSSLRPCVCGKFLYVGTEKFFVRGVTYGTFRPNESGSQYPPPAVVDRDFAQMAASGINAVRTYTAPPRWLLDTAQAHHLYVMVGLPWEQHIAFLDDPKTAVAIESRVRTGVRACAGHPAVLCYTIGNETPSTIVRWHGKRRVERFLERLYDAVKAEDPSSLVTYVNFPRRSICTCRSLISSPSMSTWRGRIGWRPTSRGCRTSPGTALS